MRAGGHATVAVAVCLVAAAAFRLIHADHSLWFDEQASAFFASQPLSRLWSTWMVRETNPPLYYTLLRGWIAVAGASDVALRVPSIAAAFAVALLALAIGTVAYDRRTGLIAALLTSVSAQHLYYSEQVRAYMLALCAVLVALLALVRMLRTLGTGRIAGGDLALYVVGATFAVYLHTTLFIFPPLALAAMLCACPGPTARRVRLLLPLVAANAIVLLLGAWWLRITALQLAHNQANIAAIGLATWHDIVRQSADTLFLAKSGGGFAKAIVACVAAASAVGAVLEWRRPSTRFLVVLGLAALGFMAAAGVYKPVFVSRTIFWISAVPLLLAAAALARIASWRVRVAVVTGLAGCLVANTLAISKTLQTEDWNGAVRTAARARGLLLVEGEGMGVTAVTACRRLYAGPCPVDVVVVQVPADRYDGWARGLFEGTKLTIADVDRLAPDRPVYMFRKEYYHNLVASLHATGRALDISADRPPLVGPLHVDQLRQVASGR